MVISCYRFCNVIIVDDGSTSPVFYDQNAGIKYLRHETNHGFYQARNTGTHAATTEWIATLDDDDLFDPAGLAFIFQFAITCRADIIHFPIFTFKHPDISRYSQWATHPDISIQGFCVRNQIPSGSWFRKSVWETLHGFQIPEAEDWDFWLRALKAGFKFAYCPKPVYWHRRSSRSKWWNARQVLYQ